MNIYTHIPNKQICVKSVQHSFQFEYKLEQTKAFFPLQENTEKINHERITNEDLEIAPDNQEISQEDVDEVWRYVIMIYLQTILSLPSIEELLNPNQVIPQYIMYNMANTSKHGVVILQDKSGRYLEKNLESFQT